MGWRISKDLCSAWEAAFLELPAQRSIYISRPRLHRLLHITLRDCRNSSLTPTPHFISTSVMTAPILPGLSSRSMDRDYEAPRPLLAHTPTKAKDITKTFVFANTANGAQNGCKKTSPPILSKVTPQVCGLHAITSDCWSKVTGHARERAKLRSSLPEAGMVSVARLV